MAKIVKIRNLYSNPQSGTTVDLLRNTETNQEYVVKRILYLDNPVHRSIFDKEIGALKKIRRSDNIVKLLTHRHGRSIKNGQVKGLIYLEYVEGDTLQNVCGHITSIADKYKIIKQLISALRCAHENGVIHRDVNPKNIMITDDLCVKLIDFGICKIKGASQKGTTYQYATNKYAAPEVCYHSENATERSDMYSLGAVIYNLFTKCEPPVPSDFADVIQLASGIDPLLKDVLVNMIANNVHDRFENMVDLEIALAPLYSKYFSNGELYYVSMDSSKISQLRRNNLVTNYKTDEQLRNEDISTNFSDAFVRCEMDGENRIYIFDGINYSMQCLYVNEVFQVTKVKRLQSYYREKNKKTSLPLTGRIIFGKAYSDNMVQHNNFELSNRIVDHIQMLRSKKNINFEYNNSFGFWHDFIKIMIEDAQKQALRFNYKSYKEKNGCLFFKLNSDSRMGDESLTSETKFIYENKDNKGDLRAVEIGTFEGYADDGSTLIIKSIKQKKKMMLPQCGTFCVDYRKQISQYRKQERSLDEFRRDETNNNNSLKGIFVGLEPPSVFPSSSSISFFDPNLDDVQKRAVCKIIDAEDIALIQGPPGTGKTNVIVEVVRQIIHYNKRNPIVAQKVLIVSQSHAAVDKIIEDLDPYLNEINAIRIGHDDEKLSDLAKEKYSLENRKALWIQKIISNSKAQLMLNLEKMKIKPDDFSVFADALENIKITNNSEEDIENYQTIIDSFYRKYHLDKGTEVIEQQIICHNWIKQLSETRDIEEYFIKNAAIVAGTCSGFVSNSFINDTTFDYVIVDEAAKATLPEIMVSLVKANKVVLVGDQMQLPPVFDQGAIRRSDKQIDISTLKKGGFGKIFEILPDSCRETLSTQYRMHPCIGDMISTVFYGNMIQNGIRAEERTLELPSFTNIAMLWVSTSNWSKEKRFEERTWINGKASYSNWLEVKILLEYIKTLDDEIGDKNYSVGVITPYRAQLDLIQKRIKVLSLKNISVEANTVDAFQGSQKDIILYSTVRSSDVPQIGFLDEHSRLNVSFSRAKRLLLIVGDFDFLNNSKIPENMFPEIIKYIQSNQSCCQIVQHRSAKI